MYTTFRDFRENVPESCFFVSTCLIVAVKIHRRFHQVMDRLQVLGNLFSGKHGNIMEGVLIFRNSSLKLKTVVGNAILLNYAVSSENISESIKIKTENGFHLKVNVCKFR